MVTPLFTVDIAADQRRLTSVEDSIVVGDTRIQVEFLNGAIDWPIPVSSTWNLVLTAREVATSVLVESVSFAVVASNIIEFAIDTTDAAVIAWLAGARQKRVVVEVSRTDAGEEQTYARWLTTIFNRGYTTP